MIEGCKHGPKFMIKQPCVDCERERIEGEHSDQELASSIRAITDGQPLPSDSREGFDLQLKEDAQRLFSQLCEGDGEHSERLDIGLIEAAFRHLLNRPAVERGRDEELLARVRNYLGNGGFFNPEAMDHQKVQRLILDIAAALRSQKEPK